MTDNVLILGAGFSYDAGIPLMSGFAERMWQFHARGHNNLNPLSDQDAKLFAEVQRIRERLDSYHGRASFDDNNIEDLLSILSFDELGRRGGGGSSELSLMSRAIARTIELTCNIKSRYGFELRLAEDVTNSARYQRIWEIFIHLLSQPNGAKRVPTILTFNYDLVLERALFNLLNSARFKAGQLPFETIRIRYHAGDVDGVTFRLQNAHYEKQASHLLDPGLELVSCETQSTKHWDVDILKLHGSVNFPRGKIKATASSLSLIEAQDDPFIMPPVFNKMQGQNRLGMWKKGLEALRHAKHVVIVGYSLPRTDIYMQYFLKAALGPNKELQKIIVFDPVLSAGGPAATEMKERYANCFSPQLKNRICFNPENLHKTDYAIGTTKHFLETVAANHSALLF